MRNLRTIIAALASTAALAACDDPSRALSPDRSPVAPEQTAGKDLELAMHGELRSYPENVIAEFTTEFATNFADRATGLSYEWKFDDGSRALGARATHAFAEKGMHEVTLLVRDAVGNTKTLTKSVQVGASISALGTVLQGIVPGGLHTCAINSLNVLYCWGYNGRGNIGDNTTVDRLLPTPVLSAVAIAQVATGQSHSCALSTTGLVYCWGSNNHGQLGDGTTTNRLVPTAVSGGQVYVAISVGWTHTCALKADSTAFCWGENSLGQLGNSGVGAMQLVPTAVSGGRKYNTLSTGYDNTCALTVAGAAYCWGANDVGQIGNGTGGVETDFVNAPALVSGGQNFSAIGAGWGHTCGLTSSNGNPVVYCWGWNSDGQVGAATTATCSGTLPCSRTPMKVTTIKKVAALAVGETHTCAIDNAGIMECWGYNGSGQLGDGTTTNRPASVVIATPVALKSVHAGGSFTCGVGIDNRAYCWGSNISGKLGVGDTTDRLTPAQVPGLTF
jgi:alpha-tubulin suppressor-like RCC1 family protein